MRLTTMRAAVAAVLFSQFAITVPAVAQYCGPRSQIIQDLSQIFLEKPHAIGLMNTGNLLEVFVSKSGSWTIIVSTRTGLSCVIAAGDAWQTAPVEQDAGS